MKLSEEHKLNHTVVDSLLTQGGLKGLLSLGIGGVFSFLLGSNLVLLVAVSILVGLDLLTGIVAALEQDRFSSNGMRKGVGKLIAYFILMILAHQIAEHVSPQLLFWFDDAMYAYLALTEYTSIAENLSVFGFKLPTIKNLWNTFKKLKGESEEVKN